MSDFFFNKNTKFYLDFCLFFFLPFFLYFIFIQSRALLQFLLPHAPRLMLKYFTNI